MNRRRLLLDCDPGQDDAIAILCAARHGELVGITTVNGNVSLDRTTTNALLVSQLAELDVPVHSGAAAPLRGRPHHADHVHGVSGLDGPALPTLERTVTSHDAVGFLVQRAADDVWLVATGPLTNIALALGRDPDFLDRFAGVVVMGGGAHAGNATPVAEFNIWADPEAAAAVFETGTPIAMIGLHLTTQVRMGSAHATRLREAGTATATMVADILDYYSTSTRTSRALGGAAMHDPCAVLRVTHPELFTGQTQPVAVETQGRFTRGMTVVDSRVHPRNADEQLDPAFNDRVDVSYRADATRVVQLILEAATAPLV